MIPRLSKSHVLTLLLLVSAALPALAEGFRLEFQVKDRDDIRFTLYTAMISRNDADDMTRESSRVFQKYMVEAKKNYAQKKGYTETLYGADYWKMARVDEWNWRIIDPESRRTVSEGGKNRLSGVRIGD